MKFKEYILNENRKRDAVKSAVRRSAGRRARRGGLEKDILPHNEEEVERAFINAMSDQAIHAFSTVDKIKQTSAGFEIHITQDYIDDDTRTRVPVTKKNFLEILRFMNDELRFTYKLKKFKQANSSRPREKSIAVIEIDPKELKTFRENVVAELGASNNIPNDREEIEGALNRGMDQANHDLLFADIIKIKEVKNGFEVSISQNRHEDKNGSIVHVPVIEKVFKDVLKIANRELGQKYKIKAFKEASSRRPSQNSIAQIGL